MAKYIEKMCIRDRSITSYAKAVVPHGTTSMISGLDEYISVSNLEGLQEIFAEIKQSPLKVFWGAPYKTPYTVPQSTVSFNFNKDVHEMVQKWSECYGVWETVTEFVPVSYTHLDVYKRQRQASV